MALLLTAVALLLRPDVAPAAAGGPATGIDLAPLTLDLPDGHYVQVLMVLESDAGPPTVADGARALDLAVAELATRSVTELDTAAERADAKADLGRTILAALDPSVSRVRFDEFLVH